MTVRQKLIANMTAQLALFFIVGGIAFWIYGSPHIWPTAKFALIAVYAWQILMMVRAGRAVWRVL
jgi:hypothetical protein